MSYVRGHLRNGRWIQGHFRQGAGASADGAAGLALLFVVIILLPLVAAFLVCWALVKVAPEVWRACQAIAPHFAPVVRLATTPVKWVGSVRHDLAGGPAASDYLLAPTAKLITLVGGLFLVAFFVVRLASDRPAGRAVVITAELRQPPVTTNPPLPALTPVAARTDTPAVVAPLAAPLWEEEEEASPAQPQKPLAPALLPAEPRPPKVIEPSPPATAVVLPRRAFYALAESETHLQTWQLGLGTSLAQDLERRGKVVRLFEPPLVQVLERRKGVIRVDVWSGPLKGKQRYMPEDYLNSKS